MEYSANHNRYQNIEYKKWYCGHWHIEKKIDRLEFLYHNIAAQ